MDLPELYVIFLPGGKYTLIYNKTNITDAAIHVLTKYLCELDGSEQDENKRIPYMYREAVHIVDWNEAS